MTGDGAAVASGSSSPPKLKTLSSGQTLAPLRIPTPAPSPSSRRRVRREPSQALAVAASIVLVILVAMELATTEDAAEDMKEWSFWIFTLVFPSQRVTWIKIVCLVVGFVLTSSYFLSSQAQLASAEQLLIHSATVLVSPLKRKQQQEQQRLVNMRSDPNASTPTGKTTAAWLASRYQSLLRTDHFGGSLDEEDEIPQLKIRDECKLAKNSTPVPLSSNSGFEKVNRKQPIAFETEFFRGQMLFMVKNSAATEGSSRGNWTHLFGDKKRMLWVQVQGHFKKPLPPRAVMYLATELPTPDGFQVAYLTKQLVTLLITLVKKFVPTAHIAFGEKATHESLHELPHAAFPLYQTVDEWVVTGPGETEKLPPIGRECFGEPAESKKLRASTPVGTEPGIETDAVYSFHFHTMYSDLARWKIVNVPGMPEMDLKRFCGSQPIRLAVYSVVPPGLHPGILSTIAHSTKEKNYIFCYSMHHNSSVPPTPGTPTGLLSPTKDNTASRPPSSPQRWRSVSCDQPDPVVRQQSREVEEQNQRQQLIREDSEEDTIIPNPLPMRPQPRIRASSSVRNMTSLERAEDLSNWSFSLPVWIERVDPAAGNRKVAYLFVVEEKRQADVRSPHSAKSPQSPRRRRCVVRSALTVKNTLLLLDASEMGDQAREFKKLLVESREFLYETICRETEQVAATLQAIALKKPDEATEVEKEKKAMLFNCLMSESQLPCIRSYQDIGVQLTKAKRDQMDIIFEKGIYRMLDPRFMRQEWFTLTTTELHFFRSFTLKPSKTILLAHVLSVTSVPTVPFFEAAIPVADCGNKSQSDQGDASPRQLLRDAVAMRATNQWFCVEIHLLSEVLTIFFDSDSDRSLCISSLNQLMKLKAVAGSSTLLTRLPSPLPLDSVSAPVRLNQRSHIPGQCSASQLSSVGPGKLLEEIVELGLKVYGRPRNEINGEDAVAFFTAVQKLSVLNLPQAPESPPSDEDVLEVKAEVSASSWFPSDDHRVAFGLNLFHALYIHTWLLYGDVSSHAQWKRLKSTAFYVLGNTASQPPRQLRVTLGDIEYGILHAQAAPGDEWRSFAKAGQLTVMLSKAMKHVQRDFRTSFALQTNCSPTTGSLIRVYHGAALHEELNATCAEFLKRELQIDDKVRVVYLPKICEWNGADFTPVVATTPIIGSKSFFCLQKLLPLMATDQHDHVQHLLLGAGKECQIKYVTRFWTQELAYQAKPKGDVAASKTDEASATSGDSGNIRKPSSSVSSGNLTSMERDATEGETGNGIPRSKSALQFLQSFF